MNILKGSAELSKNEGHSKDGKEGIMAKSIYTKLSFRRMLNGLPWLHNSKIK